MIVVKKEMMWLNQERMCNAAGAGPHLASLTTYWVVCGWQGSGNEVGVMRE